METLKTCTKCKIEKLRSEFSKNRAAKDGLQTWCKACVAVYNLEHKEERTAYDEVYRLEHKEEKAAYERAHKEEKAAYDAIYNLEYKEERAAYRLEHKEEKAAYERGRREEINARLRERRQTDPNFIFSMFCRKQVHRMLNGGSKDYSSDEYLGCTREEGIAYIESSWQLGMTWANHGEWEIHHILPLHTFDANDSESVFKACHYTNLQPLWAVDHKSAHSAKVN